MEIGGSRIVKRKYGGPCRQSERRKRLEADDTHGQQRLRLGTTIIWLPQLTGRTCMAVEQKNDEMLPGKVATLAPTSVLRISGRVGVIRGLG